MIYIYILYNRLCTPIRRPAGGFTQKTHKNTTLSTNTTLCYISQFRPGKNTQKPKTHKRITLLDFTKKTCKNTARFNIFLLRPTNNTQKHDTFRPVLHSAMSKHTNTLLFTTFPPFDQCKNTRLGGPAPDFTRKT